MNPIEVVRQTLKDWNESGIRKAGLSITGDVLQNSGGFEGLQKIASNEGYTIDNMRKASLSNAYSFEVYR